MFSYEHLLFYVFTSSNYSSCIIRNARVKITISVMRQKAKPRIQNECYFKTRNNQPHNCEANVECIAMLDRHANFLIN